MSKDDYFVIVYQVLAYLYTQLKNGDSVDGKLLMHDSVYLGINKTYWQYIMVNLLKDGFISGITITGTWGRNMLISDLDDCQITPLGIAYLCDNSFLKKAMQFLKDIKEIVPFV